MLIEESLEGKSDLTVQSSTSKQPTLQISQGYVHHKPETSENQFDAGDRTDWVLTATAVVACAGMTRGVKKVRVIGRESWRANDPFTDDPVFYPSFLL